MCLPAEFVKMLVSTIHEFFANTATWWVTRDRAVLTDCYMEISLGTRAIIEWGEFSTLSCEFVCWNQISTFFRKSPKSFGKAQSGDCSQRLKNINAQIMSIRLWGPEWPWLRCDLLDIDDCSLLTVQKTSRNELSLYCYISNVIEINGPGIFHGVGRHRFPKYNLIEKLHMFDPIQFRFGGRGWYSLLTTYADLKFKWEL